MLFRIEIILKVFSYGYAYITDVWNLFDLTILALNITTVVRALLAACAMSDAVRIPPFFSFVHVSA